MMATGEIIQSGGTILHSIFNGIRTVLTSIFKFLPYDSLLIMYIVLLTLSLIASYFFFKKAIAFNPLVGKYIGWYLLIALLIFIILAFV